MCAALYSEAVAGFDFTEIVTWKSFTESFRVVGIDELRLGRLDILALIGCTIVLLYTPALGRRIPTWALLIYMATFLALGGVFGLASIVFGLFPPPIDGEFFDEGMPRWLARGVWIIALLALVVLRFATRSKRAEQGADPNRVAE